MALQTSGQISLDDIHVEAGGTTLTEVSLNDSDVRGLIDKAAGSQNAISEYYGASAETDLGDFVTSQINGQDQLHQITVSNYISSGGTLIIPSSLWIWTNSRSTAAMTVDIPCTIVNNGKVIGCGGQGGGTAGTPTSGGPAINVTSSGVTITNASGAYIAGGGGGGGRGSVFQAGVGGYAGGGGGAGGGAGGNGTSSGNPGSGGSLNASGTSGGFNNPYTGGGDTGCTSGAGGGAGGGGGGMLRRSEFADGGGGGRILPGSGGAGGIASAQSGIRAPGGAGGSGSSAGSSTYNSCDDDGCGQGGGGGGGWGASGGTAGQGGGSDSGAAGGAAITGTSRTLSNSGTIYGST